MSILKSRKLTTGRLLKSFRMKLELTQQDVADLVEISVPNLSAIENDKRKIGADVAARFSVLYKVPIQFILFPNGIDKMKGFKKLNKAAEDLKTA